VKKRIAYIVAGVLALSVGIYVTTKLWAQPPQQPQHVQTRIGILNMGYVLKNYHKVENYANEMKDTLRHCDDTVKGINADIEKYTKAANDPQYQAKRDEYLKAVKQLEREKADKTDEMKKMINEQNDKQMVTIYKEIQDAAARYAMAQGLDLVLTHIDAVNEQDFLNPMNVMGKMQQRACMPLYYNKGMDISADIAKTLNAAYDPTRTTPTSAPATHP
jgi:Skp family chaperone for outer membrane proteins